MSLAETLPARRVHRAGKSTKPSVTYIGYTPVDCDPSEAERRLNKCLEPWCREGESNPQDPKVGGF
jgi:hypothetical protein